MEIGRFQFTGQMWLPQAGVYHYRARAYSASLGRFLQTDPIGASGGMNLYAYVHNDPINFTDPWGLAEYCCNARGDGSVVNHSDGSITYVAARLQRYCITYGEPGSTPPYEGPSVRGDGTYSVT